MNCLHSTTRKIAAVNSPKREAKKLMQEGGTDRANLRACSVTKTMTRYSRAVPRYITVAGFSRPTSSSSCSTEKANRAPNPVNSTLGKFGDALPQKPQMIYGIQKPEMGSLEGDDNVLPSDDEQGDYTLGEDDLLSGIGDDVGNREHAPKCQCTTCTTALNLDGKRESIAAGEDCVKAGTPGTDQDVPRKTFNFMYQLYLNRQMCDLVIRLGECEFWLHKMAIIEHSDKYYNMFCGDDSNTTEEIILTDTTPDAVRVALEFLYTGHPRLRVDNVEDVLRCALQLDVPSLIEQCVTFVRSSCARPSLRSLAEVRRYGLGEQLLELVSRDFKELSHSAEFLHLDVDEVCALLSENSLQVDREVDVYLAAVKWLSQNRSERQIYTVRVLECVRFALMFPSELVSVVEAQTPLMRIPEVRDMLYDAYRYHALVLSKSCLINQMTAPQPRGCKLSQSSATTPAGCDPAPAKGKLKQRLTSVPKNKCSPLSLSPQPGPILTQSNRAVSHATNETVSMYSACPSTCSQPLDSCRRNSNVNNNPIHTRRSIQTQTSDANPRTCTPSPSSCSRKMQGSSSTRICLVDRIKSDIPSARSTSSSAADNPIPMAPPPPAGRHLLVIGGTDLNCCNPDFPGRQVLRLRKDLSQWQPLAVLPVPRNNHCAVALDNIIYVIGGALPICETDEVFAEPTPTVIGFDSAACEWLVCQPMGEARLYFASAACRGRIYVFGGQGVGNSVLSSVECYDPVYDRWDCRKPIGKGVVGAAAAEFRGRIYLVGGYTWHEGEANTVNNVYKYDPACDSWTEIRPLCQGLCYAALVQAEGSLYLLGGAARGISEEQPLVSISAIMVYDICNDNWSTVAELKTPRHDTGVAAVGHKIYVAGGLTVGNKPLNSVECFDSLHGVMLARVPSLPCPTAGCVCCTVFTELNSDDEYCCP